MKRWGRKTGLLVLSLSLLLVFGLTGCLVPVDEPDVLTPVDEPDVPTPAELVAKVVEAYEGIETFQSEMSMTMHTVTTIDGKQTEMTMTSTSSGVIDLLNERMRMTMTTRVPIPEEARVPEDPEYMDMMMVMYFVDGMLYMKMSMPEMPDSWTKMEMPWGFQPVPIDLLVQLLKASEVEIRGTERVRDIDSFVVSVVPDMEKLLEIMAQQMGADPEMMAVDPPPMMPEDMFRDVAITQWIAKDTFLPVRERMQMTMVMTPNMGIPVPENVEFEMTTTMDATTYYHSYNEAVSIVLPPEAADAIETPTIETPTP